MLLVESNNARPPPAKADWLDKQLIELGNIVFNRDLGHSDKITTDLRNLEETTAWLKVRA